MSANIYFTYISNKKYKEYNDSKLMHKKDAKDATLKKKRNRKEITKQHPKKLGKRGHPQTASSYNALPMQ